MRDDVVGNAAGLDDPGPLDEQRHAEPTFPVVALLAAEGDGAAHESHLKVVEDVTERDIYGPLHGSKLSITADRRRQAVQEKVVLPRAIGLSLSLCELRKQGHY